MALDVRIASPCSEQWEAMTGEGRKRFCAKCQLHVHDVSQLTEAELVALVAGAPGAACGRLYRRADGRVMTADCPVGLARARRRLALVLTATTAMVLAAVGFRPASAGAACDTADDDESGLRGRVQARYEATKEWLRGTETFGALIDRLDPPKPKHVMGKMILVAPKSSPGTY